MKWKRTVGLEPALVFLRRVEIVEGDVKLTIREGGNEAAHKAEELDTTAPLGMRRDDLPVATSSAANKVGSARSRRVRSAASLLLLTSRRGTLSAVGGRECGRSIPFTTGRLFRADRR